MNKKIYLNDTRSISIKPKCPLKLYANKSKSKNDGTFAIFVFLFEDPHSLFINPLKYVPSNVN